MTKQELLKKMKNVNSKCFNDFQLDVQTFIIWSKKRQDLIKDIKLKDNKILRTTLLYCYDNTISLDIELMTPVSSTEDRVVMFSKTTTYEDNDNIYHAKKDMKLLYEMTKWLNNDVILSLAKNNCYDWQLKDIELEVL